MANFTNQTKNTSTFTNQVIGFSDITWDEATFTWDQVNGTWNAPKDVWVNASKNTAVFTNQTKN